MFANLSVPKLNTYCTQKGNYTNWNMVQNGMSVNTEVSV
jgi:hypothetical protein